MKIRQAPIKDLLKYLEEQRGQSVSLGPHKHILHYLNEYYCSITSHKTILPVGDQFLIDWCDQNNSPNMNQYPDTAGLILYKQISNNEFFYALTAAKARRGEVNCYIVDYLGDLTIRTYSLAEWDGWAAPTRYFYYNKKDYQDKNDYNLGERPLTLEDCGHDVKVLQALLYKPFPDKKPTGYFDDDTLTALQTCQSWLGLPESKVFNLSEDGAQIINFLLVGETK